jgi:peptidyl-prolyl cis-trans isomerase D
MMLDSIRNRAQSWFSWVIFVVVVVPFAMWGVSQYSGTSSDVNVAVVNGKKISDTEFHQAYEQQRRRIQAMMGKNFDPSLIDDDQLKKQVLENVVEREVLIQNAHDAGLRVGDLSVGAEIRSIPNLQTKGQFDADLYHRMLQSQGYSIGTFEEMVRNDLVIQQLSQGITDSAFVTKPEINALLRLKLQKRDIGYTLVPMTLYMTGGKIEDKAIKQFYKDNPDMFRLPERVRVNYLDLSVDGLAKDIHVSEDAVHEHYKERSTDFTTPEERHARHILIQVASDAPQEKVDAAKKKAEDILARIRKGESFSELAKKYSQDPGSAKEGGDLGFFGRGVMDKNFEQTAFDLKVGQVSEPIRSTFGFHIIKLESIRGGQTKSFEQVREQVENELKRQKAEDKFYSEAENLSNIVFEHEDNLNFAAQKLHLPILSTELFSRDNGSGIAANPKVRETAFSDDVLLDGKNSEAIEITQDHIVVLHIKEHIPSALRPLDEARDDIREKLRMTTAKSKVKEVGESIVQQLQSGDDANSLTGKLKLKWERTGFVARDDSKVDTQIINAAFQLSYSDDSKPVFGGKALSSGDYAVYGVYAVKHGDPASADEKTVDTLRNSFVQENGQITFKDYVDAIKKNMKITRYPDKL